MDMEVADIVLLSLLLRLPLSSCYLPLTELAGNEEERILVDADLHSFLRFSTSLLEI